MKKKLKAGLYVCEKYEFMNCRFWHYNRSPNKPDEEWCPTCKEQQENDKRRKESFNQGTLSH